MAVIERFMYAVCDYCGRPAALLLRQDFKCKGCESEKRKPVCNAVAKKQYFSKTTHKRL